MDTDYTDNIDSLIFSQQTHPCPPRIPRPKTKKASGTMY